MSYKNKVFNKLFTKEVELSKEQIELGYLQNVAKNSKKSVDKFGNTKDIIKAWQKVKQTINSIRNEVSLVRKSRKANIIGIEGHIEDIKSDINHIEAKFKEVGLNPDSSPELKEAKINWMKLTNMLKDLKGIDDLEGI